MTDPCAELATLWDHAWDLLARGPVDPQAATRFLGLASIGLDAKPQIRTVVLRQVDRPGRTLTVYTDAASPKVSELTTTPDAALLVWDPQASLQLRLNATARCRAGTTAEWSALPTDARALYGGQPRPGAVLSGSSSDVPTPIADPDAARFAVLEFTVYRADILHLGRHQNRRALFEARNRWAGVWTVP